jgi:two-component system, response regulator PdtaR
VISVRSVLICDDEPIVRANLKNKLKVLGFEEIWECCDGESAIEVALANLPDIAILDVDFPRMGGLSAARAIRQKLKMPILLLTSYCNPDAMKRARKSGVTSILTKPFRGQDLLPAIEMAFAHAEEVDILMDHVGDLKEVVRSRRIIDKAKAALMSSQGGSGHEAFIKIRKLAINKAKSMREIAEAILLVENFQ